MRILIAVILVLIMAPAALVGAKASERDAARTTVAFGAGPLSTQVPEGWTISESARGPLISAYARDPHHDGLAGAVIVETPPSEAAEAFAAYVEQAAAIVLQGGRDVARAAPEAPWTMAARLEGVMDWPERGARPTVLEARAAPTDTGIAILFAAWPADLDATAGVRGRDILAAATLETVLFDGQPSDRWAGVSVAGGDYERFARYENGALRVAVEPGSGWGKTGVWTPEPVVDPHDPEGGPSAVRLTFDLAPEETTSFALALVDRAEPDEWWSHVFRFGWSRAEDGASGVALLYHRQQEVWRIETGPEAPARVEFSVTADGLATVRLPDGRPMEAAASGEPPREGYRIVAIAHAPSPNAAASMTLKRITVRREAPPPSPISVFPETRSQIVLFDGRLGRDWVRHNAHGGIFARDAGIEDSGLVVAAAEGGGWAKSGLLSQEPMVWLDDFHGPAEATVEFEIDPDRSDGFVLALAGQGWGGVGGNDPPAPRVMFSWIRPAGADAARAELAIEPLPAEGGWSAEVGASAPSRVSLMLRPGTVTLAADGIEPVTRSWRHAADGVGLRIYAYSHASEVNAPVRFALNRITLSRQAGTTAPTPRPAAGVAPLPVKTLFDGSLGELWETVGTSGADFAQHGRFESGQLIADVPGIFSWGKLGLLSREMILPHDERFDKTARKLVFELAPTGMTGAQIMFSSWRIADMWPRRSGSVGLIRVTRGINAGRFALNVENGPYGNWTRLIDAHWMDANWDGRLEIRVGSDWLAARIPGGPAIHGVNFGARDHMTVLAHPEEASGPARFALRRITAEWVAPDAMTDAQRWEYLDDGDFDPGAFEAWAADTLDGAPAIEIEVPAIRPVGSAPASDGRRGSLWDWLNPISSAQAASDCGPAIDEHIDEVRRIQITLGEQADIEGKLVNLFWTAFGAADLGETDAEWVRKLAARTRDAMLDGATLGEDIAGEKDADFVLHAMQAALKIGLSSDALEAPTFRDRDKNVLDTWSKALKNLPEDRARALIAEMSANPALNPIPGHDFYKDLLEKGSNLDLGTVFGEGADGDRKAASFAIWTLTNNTLATFSPHYAVAKALGDTVLETAKATKAFVVNQQVRDLYAIWKEELANNAGMGAEDFYNARAVRGELLPLTEVKNMMRASSDQYVSDDAARARMFKEFQKWHQAEQAAGHKADRMSTLKKEFSDFPSWCRSALEEKVWPEGRSAAGKLLSDIWNSGKVSSPISDYMNKCLPEIELFSRFAELHADIAGQMERHVPPGNKCADPGLRNVHVRQLMCTLVEEGDNAYQLDFVKHLEDCGAIEKRGEEEQEARREQVLEKLSHLNFTKLTALVDHLGVQLPGSFYGCLCQQLGPSGTVPRFSSNVAISYGTGDCGGCRWAGFGEGCVPPPTDGASLAACMDRGRIGYSEKDGKVIDEGVRLDDYLVDRLRADKLR